jgi:ABC-type transporter Mla subunit MlaD
VRETPTRNDSSPRSLASGIESSPRGVIGRIEHHPRTAGAVILAVAIALAVITTMAVNGLPFAKHHVLEVRLPGEAPLLKAGDEVRIAGVRAGTVASVKPDGGVAVARLELDDPPGELRRARVRLRGMAGAVYVELTRGEQDAVAAVDLQHVVAGFDRDAREALARTVRGAGGGLAGRGEALNATLAAAPPALEDLTPLVRAMRPASELIDPARVVAQAVTPGLGELATAAADVSAPLADAAGPLEETIVTLPGVEARARTVLPDADPVLAAAGDAARDLEPAVGALARLLPAARGLELQAGRFQDAERLLSAAQPVLADAAEVLDEGRWTAATLAPIARPTGDLARDLTPYAFELVDAPAGFERWGGFSYGEGQAKGHKAVRFTMVFTCANHRDPYPAPGEALQQRESC